METEIQKRINRNGMVISRIPSWAKDVVIGRAEEEFCGDYGMCIAQMVRESNEYSCFKRKFFDGSIKAKLVTDDKTSEKKPAEVIKTASGREIQKPKGREQ